MLESTSIADPDNASLKKLNASFSIYFDSCQSIS